MTDHTTPTTFSTASITREAALALIAETRRAAADMDIQVSIAVTDAAGHLKAFERDDGVPFLTTDVAINKAWTAASFGLGTHAWNVLLRDPVVAPLGQIPRLMPVGGGCPVVSGGQLVGGIGVSGGNALQDQQAAEIALAALGFDLPAG